MPSKIEHGTRTFFAVHRAGDCDGRAVGELLSAAGRQVGELGSVWVRQVVLEVDHSPHTSETSLTVFYDAAGRMPCAEP